jgi:glutamate synthase domain-containing protein 2
MIILLTLPVWSIVLLVIVGLVFLIAIYDVFLNKKHTITHNFPVVGHLRYMLEKIGPELRQYIVSNNREELPFNRSERNWVYASSKKENNYQGFGSDKNFTENNYVFIKPDLLPYAQEHSVEKDFLPSAKVMGEAHGRKKPFRPRSVINISAMSFGSLSAAAVESLNRGALQSGCYHNTGEGGLSKYHSNGSDVVFHFGTGYFGVRAEDGGFSMDKLKALVEKNPFIKAIEVKLSQGAKPGKGGVLPAKKITPEIAEIRGVELGKDVLSPSTHKAFSDIRGLVDFVEKIAEETGLPVGIKSAVGKLGMWEELAEIMATEKRGPDFITVDGGEGGTGAAPPSFADHVSLPFIYAFSEIYKLFQSKGLEKDITFIASGKLGLPAKGAMAFALGADIINVAREAMLSIGCIQAQVCQTNTCPAGIATQKKWLQKGIHIPTKAERFANYARAYRKELKELSHAAGYPHPSDFKMTDIKMNTSDYFQSKTLKDIFGYDKTLIPSKSLEEMENCSYLGSENTTLK